MAIISSTTLRMFPATGVISRSATPRSAPAGIVRFFPDGGRRGRQGTNLRLSCAAPTRCAPEDRWWTTPLRPEDLVEPTGQGLEELVAIRDASIVDPLRPISLASQEIAATGGNIFRCRCFHAGVVSGPLLLVAGFCQLYEVAPNLFMDVVLGYIFHKLSVLAVELKRNGKANNICARLQCVAMVILFFKCNNPNEDSYHHFTEFVWLYAYRHDGTEALLSMCILARYCMSASASNIQDTIWKHISRQF